MAMFNYETTLLEAVNELREAYAAVEEAFTNRLRDGRNVNSESYRIYTEAERRFVLAKDALSNAALYDGIVPRTGPNGLALPYRQSIAHDFYRTKLEVA